MPTDPRGQRTERPPVAAAAPPAVGLVSEAEGDDYRVDLHFFEGPLDLLLHLIRKHEVDIYDIPIATITREYLSYLELLHTLNLEVAGSFLEMAATLAWIKSRMLLPAPPVEEGEEEGDPRAALVEQLLEYQTCKDAAEFLRQRAEAQARIFYPGMAVAQVEARNHELREVTLVDLLDAFQVVLKELKGRAVRQIQVEPVTIEEQIQVVLARLADHETLLFHDLFRGQATRTEWVVTFLALLELIRLQAVGFRQEVAFGPLWIYRRAAAGGGLDSAPDPLPEPVP